MTDHVEVRPGMYADSVSLMQVTQRVRDAPGVTAATVAMATPLNLAVLAELGFAVEAGPNDLVVAVRGEGDAIAAGLAAFEAALAELRSAATSAGGLGGDEAPRTTGAAFRRDPEATLALVSVPGPHATAEAADAIAAGRSVMIFSDNVDVEDEIALKAAAQRAGVFVMGPDCGTAVVGGVALGFANRLRPGSIGVVAASGTGAQQVTCLLDAAGAGVGHVLGVGGRDLGPRVRGASARTALRALDADPGTERIVVVSKPADPEVLADLEALAASLSVPVHWITLGPGRPDLTAGVENVLAAAGYDVPEWRSWAPDGAGANGSDGGCLRGLYCGGTLADEAMLIASETLGPIASNIPLQGAPQVSGRDAATGHVVVDFGDDELTSGRPHPMIDPGLRLERIAAEGADPTCGVLLLDLVLGYGAHPAPGDDLAAAITAARAAAAAAGRDLPVVVALVGTDDDPQGLDETARALLAAGADVHTSNARAVRAALAHLEPKEGRA